MTKLLSKQLRTLSLFALFVLLCSIPAYYYVVDSIWLEELDEHNAHVTERIQHKFEETELEDEKLDEILGLWNILQPGTKIGRISNDLTLNDTIYERERQNEYGAKDIDRYRVLESTIEINSNQYRLTVETNVEEAGETIALIGLVTICFFIVMLAGFILINRRISAKIWKPFHNSLLKLKGFRLSEEQELNFDKTSIQEFNELNAELDRLIKNNIKAYQKQKRFVENASHELQTPLAVLKSKLDLLMQSGDYTEKQSELVQAMSAPLSRMSRLNKNLLILAKIENQQYSEVESVELADVIKENLELLDGYSTEKKLELTIEGNHDLEINSNRFLLETLLNNLLTNAIKFTDAENNIMICINNRGFSISNPGSESLLTEGLFERFSNYTTDSGNSGLGLAISKEICVNNNWTISYGFDNNTHLFKVEF